MGIIRMVYLKELLNDKRVIEEINKHLWIESQKVGHSIGSERAVEEWLSLHAEGWLKYHDPERYEQLIKKEQKVAERKSIREKVKKKKWY